MKKQLLRCVFFIIVSGMVCPVFANIIDSDIEEARLKVKEGDLESAALLYKKILQSEPNHSVARSELSSVLIEAQLNDPYSEHSEALTGLLK